MKEETIGTWQKAREALVDARGLMKFLTIDPCAWMFVFFNLFTVFIFYFDTTSNGVDDLSLGMKLAYFWATIPIEVLAVCSLYCYCWGKENYPVVLKVCKKIYKFDYNLILKSTTILFDDDSTEEVSGILEWVDEGIEVEITYWNGELKGVAPVDNMG